VKALIRQINLVWIFFVLLLQFFFFILHIGSQCYFFFHQNFSDYYQI